VSLIKSHYSLLVIGGGPAGMAAAKTAAKYGVDVALVDEQRQPGGQIYRNVDRSPLPDIDLPGRDYTSGKAEVLSFRQANIDYQPGVSVWYLDQARSVGVLIDAASHQLSADKIVIAVGAQERPMPIPGWQLTGVMSAGAGQILLKSAALVPEDGVVLAGSGPLLLLIAWQYIRAGVSIRAILDTTPRINQLKALPHLPRALTAIDYLWKGLRLMMAIRRAGIPIFSSVKNLIAEGDCKLDSVSFSSAGREHKIETSLLLQHQGVIPSLHLAQAAGCNIRWNEAQQCWTTQNDSWGQSSQADIFIAGDGAGISGARAASLSGQLTGLQVAYELNHLGRRKRDQLSAPVRNAWQRHCSIRPFLERWYRVPESYLNPSDETMVCRCEEVFAGEIRDVAKLGCIGPNQAKAFTRCGMGPCQGRMCGPTVSYIMAEISGETLADTGLYRARPPIKPITLGQLAGTGFE
jgi:NADPH-dependent 2,4-dienoyl-CoA reductase/sulfur reductase-like enzyme